MLVNIDPLPHDIYPNHVTFSKVNMAYGAVFTHNYSHSTPAKYHSIANSSDVTSLCL